VGLKSAHSLGVLRHLATLVGRRTQALPKIVRTLGKRLSPLRLPYRPCRYPIDARRLYVIIRYITMAIASELAATGATPLNYESGSRHHTGLICSKHHLNHVRYQSTVSAMIEATPERIQ
jgi:hypothetical protein